MRCFAAGVAAAGPGAAARAAAAVLAALAAVAGCGSGTSAAADQAHPAHPAIYYVSLGDSLSRGIQPNSAGAGVPTSHGYPDQLYAVLQRGEPGLRLVKLGCSGETTTTMINGGLCSYSGASQLAAAVSFLRAHRRQVRLITIDIGANDLTAYLAACAARPAAIVSCVRSHVPVALANVTKIMATLRSAAGSQVRIIGMSYYVPQLAQWRDGLVGQAQARGAEEVVLACNGMLAGVYQKYGARVADVFGAFRSADFSGSVTVPGIGAVPPNVAAVCRWTWECAQPPRGPNVHADTAGYQVIAQAFLAADQA